MNGYEAASVGGLFNFIGLAERQRNPGKVPAFVSSGLYSRE
jgi:hypothetical protein